MKPHAFVAMPFGVKKDNQGTEIDFNRVYAELIKPALEAAGLEVFRADEDMRAGEIRKDMFQELLIADLVVADLTLDNPNVWGAGIPTISCVVTSGNGVTDWPSARVRAIPATT